jgi:Tfp pilus assembly protein PilO
MIPRFLAFVRSYPFLVICLVLSAGLGGTSYYLWKNQSKLAGTHDSTRRRGEDMLLSLSGLSRVTSELTTVKEALDFIEQNLIREGDLAENLGYFYQIETISRVRIQNLGQLSSQNPPEGVPYRVVPFTIRATGSYRQVLRFIRELETGPRLCRVTTYTLHGGGSNESPVQVDLSLEMLAKP